MTIENNVPPSTYTPPLQYLPGTGEPVKNAALARMVSEQETGPRSACSTNGTKDRLVSTLLAIVSNQEIAYELYQETFIRVWRAFKEGKSIPNEIGDNFETVAVYYRQAYRN